ncbi:helix-turn-helix domain-containing protein [Vibrio jasicida]|uniref:helix-turn-helix domain-containing protein n=1 Tax=Vibrio jasicida TaxID=766224 RepID=UPI0040697C39
MASNKFAIYLKNIRAEKDLTQQEMIDYLMTVDSTFSKLDITTLSRWERGTTKPKLSKQLMVARAFHSDVALLIDSEVEPSSADSLAYTKMIERHRNPYDRQSEQVTMKDFHSLIEEPELLRQITAFHNEFLNLELHKELLLDEDITVRLFNDLHGNLVGHMLFAFFPESTPIERYDPSKLGAIHSSQDSDEASPNSCLYIISTYSSLPEPRLAIILSTLDMLRRNCNVSHLIINCHNQASFALYEACTDYEIIAKGPTTEFDGVKLFGKCYRYLRLKITSDSILAAKLFSELIPYTEDLLEDWQVGD